MEKYGIAFTLMQNPTFFDNPHWLRVHIIEQKQDPLELILDWHCDDDGSVSCFFKNHEAELLQNFARWTFNVQDIDRIKGLLDAASTVIEVLRNYNFKTVNICEEQHEIIEDIEKTFLEKYNCPNN